MLVKRVVPVVVAVALAGFSAAAWAGSGQASTTVETVSKYSGDTIEARAIDQWLEAVADAEKRVTPLGNITVRHTRTSMGPMAASSDGPPVPLPGTGNPGEKITIINELPGGFTETWTFQWVGNAGGGGDWKQTYYELKAPVSEPERPEEL